MATKTLNTKIQLRRDTAANLANVVPAIGEPSFSTDTKVLKIGDGVNVWSNLPAINGGGSGSGVTDVTLGGSSVVSGGVATLPAYPVVPTAVSAFTNDAGYLTTHQSLTNTIEIVYIGGTVSGSSSTLMNYSYISSRYSKLICIGYSQYAEQYDQHWGINVADIPNTVQETRKIVGWNDPLNLYMYTGTDDGDETQYIRWNGGSNHEIYMRMILGVRL